MILSMLKLTECTNCLLAYGAWPPFPLFSSSLTLFIICLMTHIAFLSRAKLKKSELTIWIKSIVWFRGKRLIIFCKKWVALGCWAKLRYVPRIESQTNWYSSSPVNKAMRVCKEWVPCLFLAIPGISTCNLWTILNLWAKVQTLSNFWTI